MFSRYNLSQEQSKALTVFEQNFKYFKLSQTKSLDTIRSCNIFEEGTRLYFDNHISPGLLPKEYSWKWNQSGAKCEVVDKFGDIKITFFKVNSRKAKNINLPIPQYKLWIFNITILSRQNVYLSFLWCEKGYSNYLLDDTLLNELSFLKDFVSREHAEEFGWISKTSTSIFNFSEVEQKPLPMVCKIDINSNFSMF